MGMSDAYDAYQEGIGGGLEMEKVRRKPWGKRWGAFGLIAALLVAQTGLVSAGGVNTSGAEPPKSIVAAKATVPEEKKAKSGRSEWMLSDQDHREKKRAERLKLRQQAIIVRYKPKTSEQRKASLRQMEGLKVLRSYSKWNLDVVVPQTGSVAEAIKRLQRRSDVVEVIPNKRLKRYGADITREPLFAQQWGLHNVGQPIQGVSGKTDVDVNAPEAVRAVTGAGVVVAVIDSGVDVTHPDLVGRIWVNPREIPGNGVDDDGNGYVDDVNGWDFINQDPTVFDPGWDDDHGTHVAGIIAASVNGKGVVGVAPDAKIMPLKIFDGDYGDLWAALDAIAYADAMGAKIANISWGASSSAEDAFLYDIMARSRLLFVVAAGNEDLDIEDDPQSPASFNLPNQITVAATDWLGNITYYSNYSSKLVHIAAPGDEILSTVSAPRLYEYHSGTSMAAPFVTGVAALVWSKSPSLTAEQVRSVILTYSKPLPGSEPYTVTGRMVDAQRALAGLQTKRIGGADRYETAVSLSRQRFNPGVPVVYLATGQQYPDALTAVPVAGKLGGPVLLVRRDTMPSAVAQELARLKPQRIVIVGGPAVVSTTVEMAAKQYAPRVERLYGADRYGTAVKLSSSTFASGVSVAFVTTGTNFPDALVVGPAAIRLGGPVLLTKPTVLPAAVKQELQRLKPKKIVVLGGPSVVSNTVVNELARIAPVERWYGADRYATAAIVAQKTGTSAATVYLATGRDFPDALAAGVVAGNSGAPILLVNGATIPVVIHDRLSQAPPTNLMVVGGPGAVPHAAVLQVLPHLRLIP